MERPSHSVRTLPPGVVVPPGAQVVRVPQTEPAR